MELFTIIALVIGTILIVVEFLLPGGISFCIGLSSILIAIGYELNFISNPVNIFLAWCGLSVFTSVIGIFIVNKFFAGRSIKEHFDEDTDAYGKIGIVTEDVDEVNGRVQYQGTGWKAVTLGEKISRGKKVTLVARNNVTWIVESLDDLDIE